MVADLADTAWDLIFTYPETVFFATFLAGMGLTYLGLAREFSLGNLTIAGIIVIAGAMFYMAVVGGREQLILTIARGVMYGVILLFIKKSVDLYMNGG